MTQRCAPVLITVYNRLQHFINCIESLSKNSGAEGTPLFIAIDAPSREEDIEPNEKIRQYAKKITGFKSVHLFCREENVGAQKNVLDATRDVFSEYSSLIRSEDDNVFSPFFLGFVNQGLRLYEHNEKVFSVSGYNYPIEPLSDYNKNFYFAHEFSAWGVGLWREKLQAVDFNTADFWFLFRNPRTWARFNRTLGDHVFTHLLYSKLRGEIYRDTAICYHCFKHDMLSVFPTESLVRNIGNDGSGMHCGRDDRFAKQKTWQKSTPPHIIGIDKPNVQKNIRNKLNKYFKISYFRKISFYISFLFHSIACRRTIKL